MSLGIHSIFHLNRPTSGPRSVKMILPKSIANRKYKYLDYEQRKPYRNSFAETAHIEAHVNIIIEEVTYLFHQQFIIHGCLRIRYKQKYIHRMSTRYSRITGCPSKL